MEFKKKWIINGLVFLFSLFFIFYLGIFMVPKALITLTKASGSSKISIKNSLFLGEKILAKADGKDECVVTIFILDNNGKGISNKQVQISGLEDQVGVTNTVGKITFKLTSKIAKQFELMATINGTALEKTLTVTFR